MARERTLIIIGGHEDKDGDKIILREVARRVGGGRLVVTTVASHQPEGYFEAYQKAFGDLGVSDLVELGVDTRADASADDRLAALEGAAGVFFTGGDQLKITSQIGGTPLFRRIREVYEAGGVIAGTSAGASAMSGTMLVRGTGDESYRIGDLDMAPGLGLVEGVVIDQHFAQRGRIGRLLGAVAQNPRVLGLGLDEDTAIVVEGSGFSVVGSGAVYVVDGAGVTQSNIADARAGRPLSLYDATLHVLSAGDRFDLVERRPGSLSRRDAAEIQAKEAQVAEAE